mgnify:CR=1 FL=1
MRREKSERSEMVSQLLFGEVYEVLEEEDKWLNICLLHDHCCGWIDRKTYKEVSEEFAEKYRASDQLIMRCLIWWLKKGIGRTRWSWRGVCCLSTMHIQKN